MIELAARVKRLDHWVHLNTEFHADLGWWKVFLPAWNRRCMMESIDLAATPYITMFSDESGGWGCDAIWDGHWFKRKWEGSWTEQQIAIKELVPIVIACAVWGDLWQNKLVMARSDNMAVVEVITSLSSKDPLSCTC